MTSVSADTQIAIRLAIPRALLQEEYAAANNEPDCILGEAAPMPHGTGRGVSTAHFVEPVSLVATVTLAWLAKRLVDHWLKSKEQGVQIDLRVTPAAVSRIAGVPVGFVLVIAPDGTAKTIQATYEKPEDLLPVLQGIFAGK